MPTDMGSREAEPTNPGEYCAVLQRAEHSLRHVVDNERVAGHDWIGALGIGVQLAMCLQHLHSCGLLHGDFKPRNAVRMGTSWKTIDLDASQHLQHAYDATLAPNLAYMPPEVARLIIGNSDTNAEPLLVCTETLDVFSFGAVLFELCTDTPFFPHDNSDQLYTSGDRAALCSWGGIDGQRLARVFNSCANIPLRKQEFACDLISQCLNADPMNVHRQCKKSFGIHYGALKNTA